MDKTYLKIFAVLFFISGVITTSWGAAWLNAEAEISYWGYWASHNMWFTIMRSYLLGWVIMLLGIVLMGVAVYLHRKAILNNLA